MEKKYSILLVDDHKIVRNGLRMIIEGITEIESITEANNGKEAIEICRDNNFDVIFMDINMPEMNGMDAAEEILKIKSDAKIVCLSMHNEYVYISKMLSIGAYGYFLKDCEPEEFPLAIKTVANNQKYYGKGVTDILIYKQAVGLNKNNDKANKINSDITDREIEVIALIVEGLTNAEIANKLHLSTRTIDAHRRNILSKTNCKNTAALVKYAIENKLVSALIPILYLGI